MKKFNEIKEKIISELSEQLEVIRNSVNLSQEQKNSILPMMQERLYVILGNIDEGVERNIAARVNHFLDALNDMMLRHTDGPQGYFTDFYGFLKKYGGVYFDENGNPKLAEYTIDAKTTIYDTIFSLGIDKDIIDYYIKGKFIDNTTRDSFIRVINDNFGIKIPLATEMESIRQFQKQTKFDDFAQELEFEKQLEILKAKSGVGDLSLSLSYDFVPLSQIEEMYNEKIEKNNESHHL